MAVGGPAQGPADGAHGDGGHPDAIQGKRIHGEGFPCGPYTLENQIRRHFGTVSFHP
jgi:hypothetical protein